MILTDTEGIQVCQAQAQDDPTNLSCQDLCPSDNQV